MILKIKIIALMIIPTPALSHASCTGSCDIRTAVKPPSAVKPITPALNNPPKPHWRFTPIAMIEEIRHKLIILNETDQD